MRVAFFSQTGVTASELREALLQARLGLVGVQDVGGREVGVGEQWKHVVGPGVLLDHVASGRGPDGEAGAHRADVPSPNAWSALSFLAKHGLPVLVVGGRHTCSLERGGPTGPRSS